MKTFAKTLLALTITGLVACGGGGGGSTPVAKAPAPTPTPTTPTTPTTTPTGATCGDYGVPANYILSPTVAEGEDLHAGYKGTPDLNSADDPVYRIETAFWSGFKDYQYQILDNANLALTGDLLERYEIRTGDCSGSDCSRDPVHYRSESSSVRTAPGEEVWYAHSFKLDTNYDFVGGQFYDGTSIIQYQTSDVDRNTYMASFQIYVSADKKLKIRRYKMNDRMDQVLVSNVGVNKWMQVVTHAYWDDTDGIFEVWVNGQCAFHYKGESMFTNADLVYAKQGLYRDQSPLEMSGSKFNQVIYFDASRIGQSPSEVIY